MRRTATIRKADKHIETNPFCAAHPDVSKHNLSSVQSDPEEATITLRHAESASPRFHMKADRVMTVTKNRK